MVVQISVLFHGSIRSFFFIISPWLAPVSLREGVFVYCPILDRTESMSLL